MIECKVVTEPIDTGALADMAKDESAGAVAVFIGVARNSSSARADGSVVTRLHYEAYVPMAELELREIADEVVEQYSAINVLVHHRIGPLAIGDTAVAVVVATPHRAEAFDACRYVIEELKQRVPIWKKEVFSDGAEWVNPRP